MQIGEKVRFLNEVGGGIIAGFQGKDVVLVEDEDGFKIPMLRSQVVVVETNSNNFVRKSSFGAQPSAPASQPSAPAPQPSRPKERQGGDLLNVCLAFVPEDSRELSNTRFEAYLINDSNYFVSAVVANNENAAWHTRWQGTLEPNTKQLLESFDRSILNDLQRLSVQLIVWKQDKPFLLKSPVGVELRLDTVKFYKLHVFRPSPFFREPALIYDIVRGDKPVRRLLTSDEEDSPRTGRGHELFVEEEESLASSISFNKARQWNHTGFFISLIRLVFLFLLSLGILYPFLNLNFENFFYDLFLKYIILLPPPLPSKWTFISMHCLTIRPGSRPMCCSILSSQSSASLWTATLRRRASACISFTERARSPCAKPSSRS